MDETKTFSLRTRRLVFEKPEAFLRKQPLDRHLGVTGCCRTATPVPRGKPPERPGGENRPVADSRMSRQSVRYLNMGGGCRLGCE